MTKFHLLPKRQMKELKPNPTLTAALSEDDSNFGVTTSLDDPILMETFDTMIPEDDNVNNPNNDRQNRDNDDNIPTDLVLVDIPHHQDKQPDGSRCDDAAILSQQQEATSMDRLRCRRYGYFTWQSPAPLAFSYTTPCLAKIIIPLAILATHYCFYYGQTAVMWKLTKSIQYDVRYEVTTTQARVVFDSLSIPLKDSFSKHEVTDLKEFTYTYAIEELWAAKRMPGKVLPRTAAIMLALFSGVWPHLKLFMLLVTWFIAKNPVRRRRTLASLSVLGKWSLADVLVVCVMVGVLNLSWTFTSNDVMHHIRSHLHEVTQLVRSTYTSEQVCTAALHFSCNHPKNILHQLQCSSCRSTVDTLYDHPESTGFLFEGISTVGGGKTDLYVAGLPGIYAFCFAVITSILLSCIVDFLDHIDREDQLQNRLLEQQQEASILQLGNDSCTEQEEFGLPQPEGSIGSALELSNVENTSMLQPLLLLNSSREASYPLVRDIRSAADIAFDEQHVDTDDDPCQAIVFKGIALGTAGLVICGVCFTTMERTVHGGAPDLASDILGVDLTKSYTFLQLANTTALAGGWDVLLLSTFCLFIIAGPCLRALLCVYAMAQENFFGRSRGTFEEEDRKRIIKRRISSTIDFIGAFCAWEVLTAALIMVDLLMPSITSTIVHNKRCFELTHNDTCFEVGFNIHHRAYIVFIIMGGILLVLISQHIRSRHF